MWCSMPDFSAVGSKGRSPIENTNHTDSHQFNIKIKSILYAFGRCTPDAKVKWKNESHLRTMYPRTVWLSKRSGWIRSTTLALKHELSSSSKDDSFPSKSRGSWSRVIWHLPRQFNKPGSERSTSNLWLWNQKKRDFKTRQQGHGIEYLCRQFFFSRNLC